MASCLREAGVEKTLFASGALATTFLETSFFAVVFLATGAFLAAFFAGFLEALLAFMREDFFDLGVDLAFAEGFLDALAEDFFVDLAINGPSLGFKKKMRKNTGSGLKQKIYCN
jgi:hypothetical protein